MCCVVFCDKKSIYSYFWLKKELPFIKKILLQVKNTHNFCFSLKINEILTIKACLFCHLLAINLMGVPKAACLLQLRALLLRVKPMSPITLSSKAEK